MSHFTTIKFQIQDAESLIKALEALDAFDIKQFKEAVELEDYQGNKTQETAHITARLKNIRSQIGFKLEGTSYTCLRDEWEIDRYYQPQWVETKLLPEYCYQVANKEYGETYQIERKYEKGKHIIKMRQKPTRQLIRN